MQYLSDVLLVTSQSTVALPLRYVTCVKEAANMAAAVYSERRAQPQGRKAAATVEARPVKKTLSWLSISHTGTGRNLQGVTSVYVHFCKLKQEVDSLKEYRHKTVKTNEAFKWTYSA